MAKKGDTVAKHCPGCDPHDPAAREVERCLAHPSRLELQLYADLAPYVDHLDCSDPDCKRYADSGLCVRQFRERRFVRDLIRTVRKS